MWHSRRLLNLFTLSSITLAAFGHLYIGVQNVKAPPVPLEDGKQTKFTSSGGRSRNNQGPILSNRIR